MFTITSGKGVAEFAMVRSLLNMLFDEENKTLSIRFYEKVMEIKEVSDEEIQELFKDKAIYKGLFESDQTLIKDLMTERQSHYQALTSENRSSPSP